MTFQLYIIAGGITGSVKDYKFPEIPIQRMSSKEEMGHAVLFLASEAAPTITGKHINLVHFYFLTKYVILCYRKIN